MYIDIILYIAYYGVVKQGTLTKCNSRESFLNQSTGNNFNNINDGVVTSDTTRATRKDRRGKVKSLHNCNRYGIRRDYIISNFPRRNRAMTTILNENFSRNIEIMRKNIHRGMTEAQATEVIDRMESQLKSAMQYTVESREYISQMRQVVADGFGGTISAADAMRQLGVHVVRVK